MRKILFIVVTVFIFGGLNAQTSDYVGLKMKVSQLGGDTIRATLTTDYFVNMIAFEFNLNWNPNELSFVDLDYTNRDIGLFPDFFNLDNAELGRVRIIWSTAGCETLMEGDSLFSFTFIQQSADFVIRPPAEQMLFYDCDGNELRMEYIDNRGQKIVFGGGTTSAHDFSANSPELTIFPNPAMDFVKVKYSLELSGIMNMYNSSGNLVATQTIADSGTTSLDIRELKPGYYFIEVVSANGRLLNPVIIY